MFEAIVYVCVSSLYVEIGKPQCTQFFDIFGPFLTEQNCEIRSNQMKEYLKSQDGMPLLMHTLGSAPQFMFKSVCNNIDKELT